MLQTQSDYEPLREEYLDSENGHGDEATHTTAPIAMVNEPEPIPQHDEDDSNLEQQYGEMNVARGRAVEAIRNRLELAKE